MSELNEQALEQIKNLENDIQIQTDVIEGLYTQIGKLYVTNFGNNPFPDFIDYIGRINAADAKIKEFETEIKKIQGISVCPGCNAEVGSETPFCPHCGMKLTEDEFEIEEDATFCVKCGNRVEKGTSFCTKCGAKIVNFDGQPQIPVEQEIQNNVFANIVNETPTQFEYAVPTVRTCPYCNKEVSQTAKFCIGCGSKL